SSLRRVILSGEALSHALQERFFAAPIRAGLFNLYGPTEAAVDVTWWDCGEDRRRDPVPIGRPIANLRIYILDARGEPVPADVPGRLYIGGIGVGQGYVHKPELTAAAFGPDPFSGEPGARMYFTGDLARFRGDGTIEFLGRIDGQVKVGGCRIELGEIEAAIQAQPGVLDSVVVAHRDAARGDRLIAYAAPKAGAALDPGAIRAALEAKLPPFMIPSQVIPLARMPLSPNGKLDRSALPAPEAAAREKQARRAKKEEGVYGELARSIAGVFAEVLGVDSVDPGESFFELGGTSLMVVYASRMLGERAGLPVTVADIFNHPTAASLARRLGKDEDRPAPAEPDEPRDTDEPIAIIGMGCRFPGGASDAASFWALLRDGVDAITEVPRDRWDVDALYDPDPDAAGKMNSRWGGFLRDIDRFEPAFFGISPREAESLDPQHRLLLEVAFEALEDAGRFDPDLRGSDTGVYVGICSFDYQGRAVVKRPLEELDGHAGSGNVDSMASGRLAYWLGVHGPAVSVDTACSSSLVSIHLACQALRAGECRMALAGGVNLQLSPTWGVYMTRVRMASPTGRCRAFDASADGYVRAEGCGMIVLKRLSDAERDGDRILAVIRGSALNQDGRSATLTAPSGVAQEAVLRKALAHAGVNPADIDYVEAHGTGTPLGDPIEIEALASVLGEGRPAERPVLVGSVKSNFGHAEGAAGVAGVIKAVLALSLGEIPPSIHFKAPNPHIRWSELPVKVVDRRSEWPAHGGRRLAGVSSFGFSGTNAHVILEAASPRRNEAASGARPLSVLALSARKREALAAQAARMAAHIEAHPEQAIEDVCHSANAGRALLDHRAAIVAGSREDLLADLGALARGDAGSSRTFGPAEAPSRAGKIAFLFTGQGAQYAGMGRALYAAEPVFREAIDRSAAVLDKVLSKPILSVIFGDDQALLDETAYTQPGLFAIEYALAELWKSWGIRPDVVMGHSVGEIVAACVAGVFSLDDGLSLIAARGRLMGELSAGGVMVSLREGEERVREALRGFEAQAAIAAVNAVDQVVLAGDAEAVQTVVARLGAEGGKAKPLAVSHAFHSPRMDPMLEPFAQIARSIRYSAPSIPLISNVDAALSGSAVADPAYWVRHARAPVRFADGIAALHAKGVSLAIEIGPHPTLTALGSRSSEAIEWLPSLRRGHPDVETMLGSLAKLHALGFAIDWRGFDAPHARRRISLPAYPFQRTSHWLEDASFVPRSGSSRIRRRASGYALSGEALDLPTTAIHHVLPLGLRHQPYLVDHVLHGEVVVPGAFYLAVAVAVASERFGEGMFALRDVMFVNPLILSGETEIHVVLTPEREGRFVL
ncbi:MAG: acyltransferase domain-containing protein, partial [Polyangiaceae bacterium]|nr:acyltransferase domain-containing protein [Polyangiaceae bacterium]